jgi:hypothetical protein
MGAVDFRVGGRIFATLASIKAGFGNLALTPQIQAEFVSEAPDLFVPVAGGWGRMGATHIRLAKANRDILTGALHAAWRVRVDKNAATRSVGHTRSGASMMACVLGSGFSSSIRVDARRTARTGARRAPGSRARRRSCWCHLRGWVDDVCGGPRRVSARPAPPLCGLGMLPVCRTADRPRDVRVLAAFDASGLAYSDVADRRGFVARVCLFRVGGHSACNRRVRADCSGLVVVRRGCARDHSALLKEIASAARQGR